MENDLHWRVWYLTTDHMWNHEMNQLGIVVDLVFSDRKAAEYEMGIVVKWKDVVKVELREERLVLSVPGPAHGSVEG